MVNISFKDNEAILKFPKQLVSSSYVQEFFDRLRIESIVDKWGDKFLKNKIPGKGK